MRVTSWVPLACPGSRDFKYGSFHVQKTQFRVRPISVHKSTKRWNDENCVKSNCSLPEGKARPWKMSTPNWGASVTFKEKKPADREAPRKKRLIDDRKTLDKLVQDNIGCGVSCKLVNGDYDFKCQTCQEIFHKACLCEVAVCEEWTSAFCLGCNRKWEWNKSYLQSGSLFEVCQNSRCSH